MFITIANKILEEKIRTKDFEVKVGSMVYIYMLDYDLM